MQIFILKFLIKYLWIFTVLSIVSNASLTSAQEKKLELEVNDLVVPNAPASAIIGSQISLKPAITPRAFGLNILNSLTNEEGEFPNNIAVEFAPYWWVPQPKLTFDNYYNRNGFGQLIYPSLSISIASEASTIEVDGNEVDVTKLGLGLRFALIAGKANPLVEKAREELRGCLNLIEAETKKGDNLKKKLDSSENLNEQDFSGFLETIKLFANLDNVREEQLDEFDRLIIKEIENLRDNNLGNEEKKKQFKKVLKLVPEISKIEETSLNDIIDEISFRAGNAKNQQCINKPNTESINLDEKARVGFQLESASAVGFDFREDDFDEFRFRNVATWLTASYRGTGKDKASPIEFLGVTRYTLDKFEDDTNSFFDIGASLIYRLQQTPLTFSLEYIRRFGDEGDDRFVGIADYQINNDYSVFVSYGKDFETDFDGNDDLVTLFGLKVGLGRNAVVSEPIQQ